MPDMNTLNSAIYAPSNPQGRFVLTNYIDMYKLRARNEMPMDTFTSSTATTTTTSQAQSQAGMQTQPQPTMTVNVNQDNNATPDQSGNFATTVNGDSPAGVAATQGATVDGNSPATTVNYNQMPEYYPPYPPEKKKKGGVFPWLLSAGLAVLSGVLLFKNHKLKPLQENFAQKLEEETTKIKQGLEETFNKKLEDLTANHAKELDEFKANHIKEMEELKNSIPTEDPQVIKNLQEELEKAHSGMTQASEDLEKANNQLAQATSVIEELQTKVGNLETENVNLKQQITNNQTPTPTQTLTPITGSSSKTSKLINNGEYRVVTAPQTWNVSRSKNLFLFPDSQEFTSRKLYGRVFLDLKIKSIDEFRERGIVPFITANDDALKLVKKDRLFYPGTDKYAYGYYDTNYNTYNLLGSVRCNKDLFAKANGWDAKQEVLELAKDPGPQTMYHNSLYSVFKGVANFNAKR